MDSSWEKCICVEKKNKNKETILDELRQNGYRITKKRKLIIEIILKNQYTSCKEIYCETIKEDPSVGIATVYRTLRCLEDVGVIDRKNLYKVSHDYTDCLNYECTIVLKDKSYCKVPGELWKNAINKALLELYPLDYKDVEAVLLKNTD
jgi:Fur family ferric uptake transcriptional regulator